MKSNIKTLKNFKAKKTNNTDQVETSFLDNQSSFPLVVKPTSLGLNLNTWIVENKEKVEKKLNDCGAILFRDFKINTVEKFQELMSDFQNDMLTYNFRSSPRYELTKDVYVSTTYPNDEHINMHSESSYAPAHPNKITFCCITPAQVRGETPIADNRIILENLSEKTKNKFLTKGVKYKRQLTKLLGLPWQEVFQTSNKEEVAIECKKNGMNFNWIDEDHLVLDWNKKAIWEHPSTNEQIWFNHALFFNKYSMNESVLNSLDWSSELPNDTFFGDGTEISKEEIQEIRLAYEKATIKFPWEKGDVLFLDNMLMSHGRSPYEGERKIIVSIS